MTSEQRPPQASKNLKKVFLPIFVILALAWGGLALLKSTLPEKSSNQLTLKVGSTLPDLELYRPDGSKARLSEMMKTVTLINFWATWCEACIEEMPSLVKFHQTYRDRGVEVLGINLDEAPQKAIVSTKEEFDIGFENFIDHDGELSNAFDVHAIPLTVTIDSSRKILELQAGDRDWMEPSYLKKVDGWLSESSPTEASAQDQANR
ncbi:MAG: hypothetical protein RJB38_161 [Pseudomonadota bacterium]